ncbi:hypothetical protein [Roseibacillus ishigakijimensis]|uniref:F5/8 type C domain-containing protein n=1 Tax=Roseibacillus ishigakijimensis TaxID=454146 RepID=A0A934RRH1_9BACT|nr:hypothetical protein [Roseibacillus ishigakijimensis]MBK1834567.1 hypothetical protein [Roseibacillus ishigakijimensis]
MHRFFALFSLGSLLLVSSGEARAGLRGGEKAILNEDEIPELEEKRAALRAELAQLAHFTLRTGAVGTSGYRSFPQDSPDPQGEWLRIDFSEEVTMDEIVLVPTLWRHDDEAGYLADGFPPAFRLVAGGGNLDQGQVLAEFTEPGSYLPRVAPLIVPLPGVRATWLRIEPLRLSRRQRDQKYIFQLSEVMVFEGERNVALHQKVSSATAVPLNSGIWKPDRIVDGSTPYLMDAALGGEKSDYYQYLSERNFLTLDLGEEYPVSSLHLHAAYQSKSAPPEFNVNRGIPRLLLIEGARQPDFSDAFTLLSHEFRGLTEFAPILMWNFPPTSCRYLRISGPPPAASPPQSPDFPETDKIGFAEIEVIAEDVNVALGKGPVGDFSEQLLQAGWSKLTDGHNIHGHTLSIRTWMNQLARRHEGETELARLNARLAPLY